MCVPTAAMTRRSSSCRRRLDPRRRTGSGRPDRLLGEIGGCLAQDLPLRAQLRVLSTHPAQLLELRTGYRQRISLPCLLGELRSDPVPQRRLVHPQPTRHCSSRFVTREHQLHCLATELLRIPRRATQPDSFLRPHARIRCPPNRVNSNAGMHGGGAHRTVPPGDGHETRDGHDRSVARGECSGHPCLAWRQGHDLAPETEETVPVDPWGRWLRIVEVEALGEAEEFLAVVRALDPVAVIGHGRSGASRPDRKCIGSVRRCPNLRGGLGRMSATHACEAHARRMKASSGVVTISRPRVFSC